MADEALEPKSDVGDTLTTQEIMFDMIATLANPNIGLYTRQWFAEQMANALSGRPILELPTSTSDSTTQE